MTGRPLLSNGSRCPPLSGPRMFTLMLLTAVVLYLFWEIIIMVWAPDQFVMRENRPDVKVDRTDGQFYYCDSCSIGSSPRNHLCFYIRSMKFALAITMKERWLSLLLLQRCNCPWYKMALAFSMLKYYLYFTSAPVPFLFLHRVSFLWHFGVFVFTVYFLTHLSHHVASSIIWWIGPNKSIMLT